SLMTPLSAIGRCGDEVPLDRTRRLLLRIGMDGAPGPVRIGDRPGRLVPLADGFDIAGLDRHAVVAAPPGIRLRTAREIRDRSGDALALVENGKLIGVIGDDEIYRGILRQTGIGG